MNIYASSRLGPFWREIGIDRSCSSERRPWWIQWVVRVPAHQSGLGVHHGHQPGPNPLPKNQNSVGTRSPKGQTLLEPCPQGQAPMRTRSATGAKLQHESPLTRPQSGCLPPPWVGAQSGAARPSLTPPKSWVRLATCQCLETLWLFTGSTSFIFMGSLFTDSN